MSKIVRQRKKLFTQLRVLGNAAHRQSAQALRAIGTVNVFGEILARNKVLVRERDQSHVDGVILTRRFRE
jgi:hypothetical protein